VKLTSFLRQRSCCGAAAADERRRAAIDRYHLPAGRTAVNPQQRRVARE